MSKRVNLAKLFGASRYPHRPKKEYQATKHAEKTIPTDQLRPTSHHTSFSVARIKREAKRKSGKNPIDVVKVDDRYAILDGHHRAALAILNGKKTIKARIYTDDVFEEAFISQMWDFLEKANRPGLLGLIGRRIEKSCRDELASYFKTLGAKIVALHLENILDQDMGAQAARGYAEMEVSRLVRKQSPVLLGVLTDNKARAMLAADKMDHMAEADKAKPLDKVGLTGQEAADYASANAAQSVKGINQTTVDLIADAVASGIEDQLGVGGLAKMIQDLVDDMSTSRATTIASTEMNDAMSEATLRKLDRLGIDYKQIVLSDDACPICEDNADEDPIPVDEDYPSGDSRPPFHPNCRCAIVGARPPDDEEDQ